MGCWYGIPNHHPYLGGADDAPQRYGQPEILHGDH